MVLDERSRHALFVKLEEAFGTNEATTLMEHLPPSGWADVATKRDLDHLAATMRTEMQTLKADLFAAMLQQNRTLFFSMAGLMITLAALAFGAARLG